MNRAASLTVTFATQGYMSSGQLSADVDDVATVASSPYPPGSQVILRLFGRRGATITETVLGCSLSLAAKDQTLSHTETLTAIKTDQLSLSYPAKSVPTIKWLSLLGDSSGVISLDPDDPSVVILTKAVTMGIAKVTYDVSYDKYIASNLAGEKALILFEASDGRDCSTELDILQPSATRQDVVLALKDYSTDAPIVGANVSITGPFGYAWGGVTDGDGVIRLLSLVSGDYTVTASASGYQSNSQDILANDRFTL